MIHITKRSKGHDKGMDNAKIILQNMAHLWGAHGEFSVRLSDPYGGEGCVTMPLPGVMITMV